LALFRAKWISAYKMLVQKHEGKGPLRRPRSRWENCINIDTVTCYLVTRQIISGLRILLLDLLVIHQAELQLHITVAISL
jgi:hypothetical protein